MKHFIEIGVLVLVPITVLVLAVVAAQEARVFTSVPQTQRAELAESLLVENALATMREEDGEGVVFPEADFLPQEPDVESEVVEDETSVVPVEPSSPPQPPKMTRTSLSGLSTSEREDILDLHNEARAEEGVAALKWSSQLARSAGVWADELAVRGCVLEHSLGPYGETIFYSKRFGDLTPRTPEEVMDAFMDESRYYNEKTGECRVGEVCGHYTQIMWQDTKEIGCARSLCLSDMREEIWVCHYNPMGNIEGLPAF